MKTPSKALFIAAMIMCFAGNSYCISSEEYSEMGDQYLSQGKHARALTCYEEAMNLSPGFGNSNFFSKLAIVQTALGNKEKAIDCLKKILELKPGSTWIYNKIAKLYIQMGRHEDAVKSLKKYSESYPHNADTYYAIGSEYALLGKKNDSIKYFETAKKVFIESDDADGVARARAAIDRVIYSARAIVAGPYLQNVSDNGVTIIWWTDFSADGPKSSVEYGPEGGTDLENKVAANQTGPEGTGFDDRYKHEVRVTGLLPERKYVYRVSSSIGKVRYLKGPYEFRTAPGRFSDVMFAVMGEGGTSDEDARARHRAVFSAAIGLDVRFIVYCGNMVRNGSVEEWSSFLRRVICANDKAEPGTGVGHSIPVFMSVGDNEIFDGRSYIGGNLETAMRRYKSVCDNPDNGSANPDWRERYYAFSFGPAYFIVLDINNTSAQTFDNSQELEAGDTPDWEPGSEQYKWLVERLKYAKDNYPFTFIAFHASPYNRGAHCNPEDINSGYQLRELDPVFRQYGVDAVFAANDRLVERCVTGPEGYELKYKGPHENSVDDPRTWQDEENLNYFTQGNSGEECSKPGEGWRNWMSIRDNKKPPFYTAYYYNYQYDQKGWEGDSYYSSLNYVAITWNSESNKWKAAFKVVRTDPKGELTDHDGWRMERADPLRPDQTPATVAGK